MNQVPKPASETAKLGGAYGLFLTSFLLQLQDPEKAWTVQAIVANVLVFASMMLTKSYNVRSDCTKPSDSATETASTEPTAGESQSTRP
jgi:hypothetical protein